MKFLNTPYTAIVSSVSCMALGAFLVGCEPTAPQEMATQSNPSVEALPEVQMPGDLVMPQFLKPPHTWGKSPEALAKIASGYRYAQGMFDDDVYYGIYSYVDDNWSYVSTSIWDNNSNSMSNGMDVSSTGETWLQSGSYFIDVDGIAYGDYATSYTDADGIGTQYLTDFQSSADSASYRSTIDHSNTKASPDCLYLSDWMADQSTSHQSCVRDDDTFWSCDYNYRYIPTYDPDGVVTEVQYVSSQLCDDSATSESPDYRYDDTMTWNYQTGVYTDSATMHCFEEGGVARTFTYEYADGSGGWFDENHEPIDAPTCGWSQGGSNQ